MDKLLTYRKPLLWVVVVLTLVFGYGISRLSINFSFESFYPTDDPEALYHDAYQARFSEDQNYMVYIALKSPAEDIFDSTFLTQSQALLQRMALHPGVDSVVTALNFQLIRRRGLGYREYAYLDIQDQASIERSRERIQADTSFKGIFITHDYRHLCAYYFIDPDIFDTRDRDLLSNALEADLESSGMDYVVTGIPFIRTKYVEKIAIELGMFVSMAIILIIVVLWFTYRNGWGVLIPQVAVLTGLAWTLGLMGWTGESIDLINNLLIPILFVVGMSDVIHLTTRYLFELRAGRDRDTAMALTLKEIGLSIFLTSFTTAVGFASLLISRIPPIRYFGLYAAAGVIFTFFISVVILPNALIRINPEKFLRVKSIENFPWWDRNIGRLDQLTKTHGKWIVTFFVLLIMASGLLIFRIPTQSYLIEDIGKNDPIRKSMEFFEENGFGLRPFEVGIEMTDSSRRITDREVLLQLQEVQDFLGERVKFSPFLSPVNVVRQANYLYHYSRDQHFKIPDTQEEIDELYDLLYLQGGEEILKRVQTPNGMQARLSSRIADIGTDAFAQLWQELELHMAQREEPLYFRMQPTGHAYLTEQNLLYVRYSLLGGLAIAFVVIAFVIGWLFRSGKILMVSMVPNIIPLILTGGFMGLFGIQLTASTALVFVIAFGIAVDDTIHFLSRYRIERNQGATVDAAISATMQGTGKAMIITSLILIAGFVLLIASDFGGTFNTGLFTALTIVFALLADLVLLPVLLRWVDKDETPE
ncbi:MAG: MMPL family transporter [Bacteroidota bacterium]